MKNKEEFLKLQKKFNALKKEFSTGRKNIRKMRTKSEIKNKILELEKAYDKIESELNDYKKECQKNNEICELEITEPIMSDLDKLNLKIFTLQWVLGV